MNTTVGFASDAIPDNNRFIDSHTFNTFASGLNFVVKAARNNLSSGFSLNANIFRSGKFTTIAVRTPVSHGTLHIAQFAFGAPWGSVSDQASTADIGVRRFNTASIGGGFTLDGYLSFTDEYFLFTFQQNSTTDYGWIEVSMNEPSLAESGLAALILGAEGLRSCRKACNAAHSTAMALSSHSDPKCN